MAIVRRSRAAATAGAGFTLVELLVVMALIAIASSVASLALRDPASTRLDREAVRLGALLEAARVEARSSGIAVRWELTLTDSAGNLIGATDGRGSGGFRFVGLPPGDDTPTKWLTDGVSAEIVGARAIQLGPDPVLPPQRIVLRLDQQQVVVATDGLAPFAVVDDEPVASP
jgi:general secretion pathway protein H